MSRWELAAFCVLLLAILVATTVLFATNPPA